MTTPPIHRYSFELWRRCGTSFVDDPTPRLSFNGDTHPITRERVLRMDRAGIDSAAREMLLARAEAAE